MALQFASHLRQGSDVVTAGSKVRMQLSQTSKVTEFIVIQLTLPQAAYIQMPSYKQRGLVPRCLHLTDRSSTILDVSDKFAIGSAYQTTLREMSCRPQLNKEPWTTKEILSGLILPAGHRLPMNHSDECMATTHFEKERK